MISREALCNLSDALRRLADEIDSYEIPDDLKPPEYKVRDPNLSIGYQYGYVKWKGEDIGASKAEAQIVTFLARHPNMFRSREQIMDELEMDYDIYERAIDSRIKRIRRKFENVDPTFDRIHTRYGIGYKWNLEFTDTSNTS